MASIVLLLSELLGGAGSTSMLEASCYMGGHSLREFRPAAAATGDRAPPEPKLSTEAKDEEPSSLDLEDLSTVSRISVDVMWP
ncbi:hypothetical protein CFC21_041044 [Triticum aestivum]|uniref:Secreted protein n=2 Tax=Triticum aestivum TaxID=4565 RepID=A0A077RZU9_WHEAT|nr:uncharacterized protein LOC123069638 [Triticum aestivum]KAF7029243.1 hypothetical protein CFC21_041044 [Triticum aestivum]CDM82706.1 unnamed protein product [Triticum aestivum]CDM82709.1 unnamed protein product [Triticum aestivum]CDM82730.1 unnamed protein product [Triticum aestivum]